LLVFTLPSKLVGCAEKEGLVVVTYALFWFGFVTVFANLTFMAR
jgi:hypothetical protein